MNWTREEYEITTAQRRVDIEWVHAMLSTTYWAAGRTREQVATSIRHAIPFSMFRAGEPVGFGRIVTDRAVFGYIADVFIAPAHRGKGLGKWLLSCMLAHPMVQDCKLLLETKDAQDFYAAFGFSRRECMRRPPVVPE